jgi:hypothetical protein
MKAISLCVATLCATASFAQSNSVNVLQAADKKNEIGAFVHTYIGDPLNKSDVDIVGVNYNRWVNANLGYRIIAGYGNYTTLSGVIQKNFMLDTFIDKNIRTHIGLGVVGAGLQAQKQVYKKIYLFAAIEVRMGYGSGTIDTAITKTYRENEHYATKESLNFSNNANMFYAGLSPTAGIKLSGKRLSGGIELYGLNLSYQNISNVRGGSIANFNMGNIGQRLFINYRF